MAKTSKLYILTSILGAQHPNAGRNIQQLGPMGRVFTETFLYRPLPNLPKPPNVGTIPNLHHTLGGRRTLPNHLPYYVQGAPYPHTPSQCT